MCNLPEYKKYNNEKNIALWDNSSVEFLRKLDHIGIDTEFLLAGYDVILIPNWVMEEVNDSEFRVNYLNDLYSKGIPIYTISEKDYSTFANDEDIEVYKIVEAAIFKLAEVKRYFYKNVKKDDLLDLEDSAIWLPLLHQNWPATMQQETASGRMKKKNAGEVSLTILAEVFSWYYPLLNSLTMMTQDYDAYDYAEHSGSELKKNFVGRSPVKVSYKSNDFFICQLYRSGKIDVDKVNEIRKDARKVTYTKERPDKSVALITEQLNNEDFEKIIQDETTQIIF